ncbi:hypothetical protein RFI_12248 [Reticulomyxa filosa]|uniref:PH domain-containing protein n=1 Tax=Reticulomyxa filosa TaxID=46433 RepID=X6NGA5_RETFI|nr:hypothetical protein RFI_12248 [Reticulomyxa filosa]|eukprot:ETO24908.1 hypothetical protein RFI_12248 [Reticulomyxa filosa]
MLWQFQNFSGNIQKLSAHGIKWNERWAIVSGHMLQIYSTEQEKLADKQPKYCINLTKATIFQIESNELLNKVKFRVQLLNEKFEITLISDPLFYGRLQQRKHNKFCSRVELPKHPDSNNTDLQQTNVALSATSVNTNNRSTEKTNIEANIPGEIPEQPSQAPSEFSVNATPINCTKIDEKREIESKNSFDQQAGNLPNNNKENEPFDPLYCRKISHCHQWNSRFQKVVDLAQPKQSEQLQILLKEFVATCKFCLPVYWKNVVKTIVHELLLPDTERTMKPVEGSSYLSHGIVFTVILSINDTNSLKQNVC